MSDVASEQTNVIIVSYIYYSSTGYIAKFKYSNGTERCDAVSDRKM